MASSQFVAITIAILFGVNLIVTGVPVDKVETTTEVLVEDDNVTGNGTHKEL
jgi:hypothetical protein